MKRFSSALFVLFVGFQAMMPTHALSVPFQGAIVPSDFIDGVLAIQCPDANNACLRKQYATSNRHLRKTLSQRELSTSRWALRVSIRQYKREQLSSRSMN